MNQNSIAPNDFGFPPALCRVLAFSLSVGCELPEVRAERSAWSLDPYEVRPMARVGRIITVAERVR